MLVLSRKSGERIVIGPNIELTILEVRGDRVHVGIKAPKDVSIHREEVYRRIHDVRPCEAGSDKFPEILINMNGLNYGYSDGPS